MRAFKLSPQVTHVLASERMLFTLSHNDDLDDKCSVSQRDPGREKYTLKNTCDCVFKQDLAPIAKEVFWSGAYLCFASKQPSQEPFLLYLDVN